MLKKHYHVSFTHCGLLGDTVLIPKCCGDEGAIVVSGSYPYLARLGIGVVSAPEPVRRGDYKAKSSLFCNQFLKMATVVGRVRPLFSLSRSVQGSFKASTTLHSSFFSTSTPRPVEPAWRSTTTTMTSSEAFTETMVAHGVNNMFGIVGSAFMDALDIFPAAGIRC